MVWPLGMESVWKTIRDLDNSAPSRWPTRDAHVIDVFEQMDFCFVAKHIGKLGGVEQFVSCSH